MLFARPGVGGLESRAQRVLPWPRSGRKLAGRLLSPQATWLSQGQPPFWFGPLCIPFFKLLEKPYFITGTWDFWECAEGCNVWLLLFITVRVLQCLFTLIVSGREKKLVSTSFQGVLHTFALSLLFFSLQNNITRVCLLFSHQHHSEIHGASDSYTEVETALLLPHDKHFPIENPFGELFLIWHSIFFLENGSSVIHFKYKYAKLSKTWVLKLWVSIIDTIRNVSMRSRRGNRSQKIKHNKI